MNLNVDITWIPTYSGTVSSNESKAYSLLKEVTSIFNEAKGRKVESSMIGGNRRKTNYTITSSIVATKARIKGKLIKGSFLIKRIVRELL